MSCPRINTSLSHDVPRQRPTKPCHDMANDNDNPCRPSRKQNPYEDRKIRQRNRLATPDIAGASVLVHFLGRDVNYSKKNYRQKLYIRNAGTRYPLLFSEGYCTVMPLNQTKMTSLTCSRTTRLHAPIHPAHNAVYIPMTKLCQKRANRDAISLPSNATFQTHFHGKWSIHSPTQRFVSSRRDKWHGLVTVRVMHRNVTSGAMKESPEPTAPLLYE